jgi:hypothetical protein
MSPVRDINAPIPKGSTNPPVASDKDLEPSLMDEVAKARRLKKVEQIIDREFPPPEKRADQGESIATTIVNKALDNLSKAEERAEVAADKSREEVAAAGEALDKAKEDLYRVQYDSIKEMVGKLTTALEDIRKGVAKPKTLQDIVGEAKELDALLHPEGSRPPGGGSPPAVDTTTQITMLKMQQDHELAMKNLELQIMSMNKEWDLKLLEFRDNKDVKLKEYEDGKKFRSEGLGALQDVVMAINQGVERDMEDTITGEPKTRARRQARPRATEEGEELEASIKSFPCQTCGEKLAVSEEGGQLTCPQCGTEYNVTRK